MPDTTTTGETAATTLGGTELVRGVQSAANVKITTAQIATLANSSTRSVATGGTGATTASAARTSLGVVIGTDVQAYSANLAALSAMTLDTDGALTANSDVRLATQQAVKEYVDAQVVSASGDVVGPASSTDGLPPVFDGASGKFLKAATAATIRENIGAEIGVDVQGYSANLASIAGLTSAADRLPYFTGSSAAALATFTSAGRALVDDADASAQRTTLLASARTQTEEMISGYIGTVADKTYKLIVKAAHAGTITEATTISESGTCTATFKINATALGGTANSVSSSETSQAHASTNAFSAGDDIQLTVSSNSTCLGLSFTLKYTRVYQ